MTSAAYQQYYTSQCGGALPVYRGGAYQRGYGMGDVLKGALRTVSSTLLPLAKNVGKRVLGDVLFRRRNVVNALKHRALQAGRHVGHNLVDSAVSALGGIKRPAPTPKRRPAKVRKVVGRKGQRRKGQVGRGQDIFG